MSELSIRQLGVTAKSKRQVYSWFIALDSGAKNCSPPQWRLKELHDKKPN